MAPNFFVTKATDLRFFLIPLKMGVTIEYLFKKLQSYHFFGLFFQPSLALKL